MAIPGYGPDMLLVEIKDFNALIDNKPFLNSLLKKNRRASKTRGNVKK